MSWISLGSDPTWKWCGIPRSRLSPTARPPPWRLCFSLLATPQTVPEPFLGLINLLDWLTESRRSVCLVDCLFIIKGHNPGTARWKRCKGQGMRQSLWCFSALSGRSAPFCHQHRRCSPTQKLSEPCSLVFPPEGSFHRHD